MQRVENQRMRFVEQRLNRKSNSCFAVIDIVAFATKDLYNQANYQIRQTIIQKGKYLLFLNSMLIQLHHIWQPLPFYDEKG